jgi:uncharacterized membrane protein YedE/YeeE
VRSLALSYAAGAVFGVGLALAGMTQPAKVVGFLDVLGRWDPSLAFVMGGAIAVHALAYRLVPRMPTPVWAARWGIPTRRDVDARLIVGAAMFGAGWGLGGYCPGPALTSLFAGASSTLQFTGSMLVGMWAHTLWEAATAARPTLSGSPRAAPVLASSSKPTQAAAQGAPR